MSDSTITFLVLGIVVVAFISNRIPVEIVAVGTALALYFTGVLDLSETFAGFGDPIVIFIAALFVVSEGLDASGVTTWTGQQLVERAGTDRTRLIVLLMLVAAVLTALINPNGSTAALLPVVVIIALKTKMAPSQLLMPLAFAAHPGSLLALTGSVVNVIASDASADAGAGTFGYLEFSLVGIPLVAGCIAIVVLFGERLLPERHARSMTADFSAQARTLTQQYGLTTPDTQVFTEELGFAEVVIPPRSGLIGEHVFPGMLTESGDLVIVAVQRGGEDVGEKGTELEQGDVLLLRGPWTKLDINLDDPDVLIVDSPEMVRRQVAPLGRKAFFAVATLAVMVLLLMTNAFPAAIAATLAAGAMVLTGVLNIKQALRSVSWTTVILVGGMIPLSTAMIQTGAADDIAGILVDVVGSSGSYPLLIGIFLITVVFGQMISNTATALIVTPIALASAVELDVSVQPLLMTVAVAAAASFLTPIATPANLMVMEPAGYRFNDYWKLGLPMMLWFFVVSVVLIPLFWQF